MIKEWINKKGTIYTFGYEKINKYWNGRFFNKLIKIIIKN